MKTLSAEIAYFVRAGARRNIRVLIGYFIFLAGMITAYSLIFQFLMLRLEGREYSFITGVYWTITAMTTLGYGDITFTSDPGYFFSAVVTVSGVIFMLILLPFGLISLFLAPWIEDRLRYHPLQELPEATRDHVIIFGIDPVTRALQRKLQARNISCVFATQDLQQAQRLQEDEGLRVVWGDPADPLVLKGLRVHSARHIIANLGDASNTNVVLTIRSLCKTPVTTVIEEPDHGHFLRLAGADHVIPLKKILGRYLATRATTRGALAHVIDSFGKLVVAEMPVHGTPFKGLSLSQAQLRQRTGLVVVGIWERGNFTIASAETMLTEKAVMVLVGTHEQLEELEKLTGETATDDLILILGHGRIGCSAASFFDRKPVPYILIDREPNPHCSEHVPVIGDATSRTILKGAAIDEAKGLIVTTNDDNANIFFTLASRHLNPHVRIVARANREENVEQLYAAGADFVVSNASVGASILHNTLENKETIFLTEGVYFFRRPLSPALVGKSIEESRIRPLCGCTVVALELPQDETLIAPPPETILTAEMKLILVGSSEQEARFVSLFP